jgi:hypothetical protein
MFTECSLNVEEAVGSCRRFLESAFPDSARSDLLGHMEEWLAEEGCVWLLL